MATWDVLHSESLEVEHAVPHAQVLEGLAEGRISRDDCVRKPGDERWWHIYEVPELRSDAPEEPVIEPSQLEEGSLRGLLAQAEPPQPASPRRRPVPPPPAIPAAKLPMAEDPAAAVLEDADEGMPYKKKIHAEEDELDMTPMVDVAMQLILFFMVTSTLILQSCLEFPRPAADDSGQPLRPEVQKWDEIKIENIAVEVKADNQIYLDDSREATKETDLATKLAALKREKGILGGIILRAHEDAFHEKIVAVIDAANVAELKPIKMAAMRKGQKKTPTKKRAIKND